MNAARSALVKAHWPSSTAFLDLSNAYSITTDYATCTGIALCDDAGQPTRRFSQGQSAHIYSEYAITQPITVPSGGVEIHDGLGQLVHGKNTFQYGTTTPHTVPAGARLRFHQVIQLEIGTGEYHISVGLASVSIERYLQHQEGTLADEIFRQTAQELCRVMSVISFLVELDPDHRLLHHGMA